MPFFLDTSRTITSQWSFCAWRRSCARPNWRKLGCLRECRRPTLASRHPLPLRSCLVPTIRIALRYAAASSSPLCVADVLRPPLQPSPPLLLLPRSQRIRRGMHPTASWWRRSCYLRHYQQWRLRQRLKCRRRVLTPPSLDVQRNPT